MTVYALEELILMADGKVLPCRHCSHLTRWRIKGQSSKGTCPDHVKPGFELDIDEMIRREWIVLDAFPDTEVIDNWKPPRYAPDAYPQVEHIVDGTFAGTGERIWHAVTMLPRDAGPCEGCRRTIRRYGDLAYPRCTECDELERLKK